LANINTPISATATKEQTEDKVQNPETAVGGDATCGQNVFITLKFTGAQTIKPVEIYEMVDAKYGTVASVKATVARGTYIFDIAT
jgi:anti-sigma28 factor (negative regulator of flagellin synthesis)